MALTQITTGGVDENINIDSNTLKVDGTNNRVGIGAADVNAPLEVRSQSALQIRTSTGTGNYWEFGRDDGTGDFFLADDGLGTVVAVDQLTGNVGIGTASPGKDLEVYNTTGPSIRLNDGGDYKSYFTLLGNDLEIRGSSGNIEFYTGSADGGSSTERLRINSSGLVGIGESSPTQMLVIRKDSASTSAGQYPVIDLRNDNASGFSQIRFMEGGTENASIISSNADNDLRFRNNGATERMRIDSDGRVLIKTTSTINAKNYADDLVIGSVSGDNGMTIVSGTSSAGSINFSDGTGGASHKGLIQYDHTGNYMRFYTDETERVRITHDGYFLSGTTHTNPGDANTNTGFSVQSNGKIYVSCAADGGHINRNNTGYVLHTRNNGNHVGGVYVTSSATSYQTSSDYRLKENVVDLSGAITRVKQLAPKRFNFIIEPGTTVDGFLAHEAQTVVPEAVTGTHNEVDGDGNPVMQGIDQSKLVPLLTAALQEAIAKIETLETKVAALEAAE